MVAAAVARWEMTSVKGRLGQKPKKLGPAARISKEKMVVLGRIDKMNREV
jgi:hypothetical protein